MTILLIWVTALIGAVVLYLRQVYSSFNKHDIKYFKPVPLLGNMAKVIFHKEHVAHNVMYLYNSFPEERFVGRYELLMETIVIRDIELLKKILVKDFEHFLDHTTIEAQSVLGRSLFFMKGEPWKEMRSALSPAFTSSKIRLMVPFMMEIGDQMIRSLNKKFEESKDDYLDVDCRDLTTRYSNDVIASCAFGLQIDSQSDRNNEFYELGKSANDTSFIQILLLFFLIHLPFLLKILDWDLIPKKTQMFFKNLVLNTIKEREERNIFRPDMIHLLMEAKKGKLSHDDVKPNDEAAGFATVAESSIGQKGLTRVWTDDDLVAQAFLFFTAAFEFVSTTVDLLLYEMAVHPDMQERLAKEIREHDDLNGGKFDFKSIQNLKYLDMVVSEVLRLWPPNVLMDRLCTKDYNMGKPNEAAKKEFIIRKGTRIIIPVYAFHHDPQFFPEPQKFDPERFSDENEHKINSMTYLPFGAGPRNCIGSRFALCEIKVMAYQLLRQIEVFPCEKTCIPARLTPGTFNTKLQGGHWLRFRLRK